MTQGPVILMALTFIDSNTLERWDGCWARDWLLQEMVFCYLYKLFWEMHLLF